jgi:hypothetical protein
MLPFRGATGQPAVLAHRERGINYVPLIPTLFHGKAELYVDTQRRLEQTALLQLLQ